MINTKHEFYTTCAQYYDYASWILMLSSPTDRDASFDFKSNVASIPVALGYILINAMTLYRTQKINQEASTTAS
jgi:hypothetical protein